MPTRLAASLLVLALAATPAFARDARQLGANGDGGCPDQAVAAAEAHVPGPRRTSPSQDPAPRDSTSVRPAASRGGDDAVRPPRWHSFLPGMFR